MELDERIRKRMDYLFDELKMIYNGSFFIGMTDKNRDFNISTEELQFDSDEAWEDKIQKLKIEFKKRGQ